MLAWDAMLSGSSGGAHFDLALFTNLSGAAVGAFVNSGMGT